MLLITLFIIITSYVFLRNNNSKHVSPEGIRKMIRQIIRYGVAAEQDENPFIEVLHANYSKGILDILKTLSTTQDIESAIGGEFNFQHFMTDITRIQDNATLKLSEVCGISYVPEHTYLSQVAKTMSS